MILKTDVALV